MSLRLLALLAVAVLSCGRRDGPAETYRAFATAAREGRADVVWSLLSERSRASLDARAHELARAAPPGTVSASGVDLVLGDGAFRAPKVKSAIVLRESGDAAVVAVELEGGERRDVELVREGEGWKVVIPPAALGAAPGGQGR
jgi:hypothetical protein